MKRAMFPLLALLGACAAVPSPGTPVTGEWGGNHVRLSISSNGGILEYDCAAGTVASPLLLQRDGTFTAEGIHTPGWGGPEIESQKRPSYRVRYSGRVRGNEMSLQGQVENGVLLGPFKLRRGAEPMIFRCL